MIPIFIISQIAGIAGQQAAANDARRRALGLPCSPPPAPKTPDQLRQDKRDDRLCGFIFALYFLFGAVVFCTPPIMFIYCVIKFAFAAQGMKFP